MPAGESLWPGTNSSRVYKYWNGFRPLALAVSIMLRTIAVAFAPSSVSWNRKFFLEVA
jgi:hypothetical protein